MADLVSRRVTRLGGKTYVRHRYSNGHVWVIIASVVAITARLVSPDPYSPRHRLERRTHDIPREQALAPQEGRLDLSSQGTVQQGPLPPYARRVPMALRSHVAYGWRSAHRALERVQTEMIELLSWLIAFVSLILCAVLDAYGVAPTAQMVLIVIMVVFAVVSSVCGWVRIVRNPPPGRRG